MKSNLDFFFYDYSNLHETQQTTMTIVKSCLQPPVNHNDLILTEAFQHANQENDIDILKNSTSYSS